MDDSSEVTQVNNVNITNNGHRIVEMNSSTNSFESEPDTHPAKNIYIQVSYPSVPYSLGSFHGDYWMHTITAPE